MNLLYICMNWNWLIALTIAEEKSLKKDTHWLGSAETLTGRRSACWCWHCRPRWGGQRPRRARGRSLVTCHAPWPKQDCGCSAVTDWGLLGSMEGPGLPCIESHLFDALLIPYLVPNFKSKGHLTQLSLCLCVLLLRQMYSPGGKFPSCVVTWREFSRPPSIYPVTLGNRLNEGSNDNK